MTLRAMRSIAIVALLSGCATDGMTVRWRQHEFTALQEVCRAPGKILVDGCYQRAGNVCVVSTWRGDPGLHDTLGHEVRHCFEGAWH